ncbi:MULTISPECIES: hypothetical protein [Anaerococcus]|uniref:hypothetical protein n=1 Tax=Anaerococcus TaxID=165779 RepID=UPI001AE17608|nr:MULTISPECIES: hypothetical protein [Anaerococcus]MBP2069895.1 hypothetical protein [Anaerococcus nagyae]MDU3211456.1 hypothetical protein [Anaerococcus sp.]
MRRDYKFSSVIIIQIIVTLILVLIVSLTGAYANSDFNTGSSILNTILTTAVQTIFGFIIARGLVFNRMGSLGEYFDNFNYLTLKLFGLCFIISILPYLLIVGFGIGLISSLTSAMISGNNFAGFGSMMGLLILLTILSIVYTFFTAYNHFVAADNPDLSFGELFKKVFKIGSDLFSKTFKTYLKWLILPSILYIFIIVVASSKPTTVGNSLSLVLSILFVIYIIFIALVFALVELSDHYLDYKYKEQIDNDEKISYEV